MRISRRAALVLLAMLLILFLVGTQMPGHSRNAIEASLHAPFPLSKLAHFCMFATMAVLASGQPLRWPVAGVLLGALALGVLTEVLQVLVAIEREGSVRDVAIDVAGAVSGVLLTRRPLVA
ncbi:VanZ family protein [Candidatus Aalborgicola defluviihabitans]|uniref:VanZ family protein n=1 Tax=Candidatus Aalborgicola defluviihabitans TaxID=3386187 RepID=UPI0039B98C69